MKKHTYRKEFKLILSNIIMSREELMVNERKKKIEELKKLKINPYAYSFQKKNSAAELQEKYSKLKPEESTKDKVTIAGRVMSIRDIGKLIFAMLQDSTGRIQFQLQTDETPEKEINFFKKYIDTGDIIGIEGNILRTKRGELSILAKKVEILTKSLSPLPEKWHGLVDKEDRYRKRYLDLIMNPEVKKVFDKRTAIINAVREFLNSKGFIEVETPILQPVYGGAEARPFKTNLHELKIDMFLSISPELYLKRLIIGGYEKVYTICKNFRNEGIDKSHNPEFTMLEAYQSYADYEDMMNLFEEIFEYVLKKVVGKTEIEYQGHKLNFKRKWERVGMQEGLRKYAKIDVKKMSDKEILNKAKELKLEVDSKTPRGLIIAELSKELVEPKLIQPTHMIDHTKETTTLCKCKRCDEECIERDEPFVAGMEIGNIYSELNDPILQRKLFEHQAQCLAEKGLAHPLDKDFVESLGYGMTPTGGLGLGIDRMVMLLTDSPSIRDVILFPFMKPIKEEKSEKKE
jgi:lysyl-tRNA synthetase class 2